MLTNLSISAYAFVQTALATLAGNLHREEGQDLIEYAMLGGLIAAAIVAVGILLFSGALTSLFTGISNCIDFNTGTTCAPGF